MNEAGLIWRLWLRNVHVYASLAMSALFLFFGVSGFLASRPELFATTARQTVPANIALEKEELSGYLKSRLPGTVTLADFSQKDQTLNLIFENDGAERFEVAISTNDRSYTTAESHPLPSGSPALTNSIKLAECVARPYPGHFDPASLEESGGKIQFALESVWATTTIEVDRQQKRYQVHQERNPWANALVQLHRGKKTRPLQRILIDATACFMVLATLTGMIMGLQSRNPGARLVAFVLVGISLVLTVVMILNR
jgi:hypothetical protein